MSGLAKYRILANSHGGLLGAFLAAHAISDALPFLVTGIGCKAKVTHPLASHDQVEDFTTRMGWAEFDESDLISGNLEKLRRNISGQLNRMPVGFMPVVISPVVKTVGLDIGPYLEQLSREFQVPIRLIPNSGADSDLWEGYCEVLKAFSQLIDWDRRFIQKNTVNIWGYPFDRYEQDHQANIKVLTDMLAKIGLRLNAVFFSGTSAAVLRQANKAEYNIILPHACRLGHFLEKTSQRRSLYTDIPLGLRATARWLQHIAKCTHRDSAVVQSYIKQEEAERIKLIQQSRKKSAGATAIVILEVPWLAAMTTFLAEIGIEAKILVINDRYYGGRPLLHKTLRYLQLDPRGYFILDTIEQHALEKAIRKFRPRYLIGSSLEKALFAADDTLKKVTFGFPSYDDHHTVSPEPFLGYTGLDHFIPRILN